MINDDPPATATFSRLFGHGFKHGFFLVILFLAFSCNEQEDLVAESEINRWEYFRIHDGLPSNYINTIFEDSKGNVWIGTDRGISVYDGENFTNYDVGDGLLHNNVFAICEDQEGLIWVGTPNGVNILTENIWYYINYDQFSVGVYSLLALKDNKLLIGTGGNGIYQYDYATDDLTVFNVMPACSGCNSINSLFRAKDESVWVGSFEGARKIKGNTVTTYKKTDGLAGNIATNITEDSWGNIWVGTVEGKTISKITGNSISQVSFNNGAGQNFIFTVQEANDGNLWIGTVLNGLFLYDGAVMTRLYEGPPDNIIICLLKDHRGNLWIGTSKGGLAKYITHPLD